jgi:hypothetical protein
LGSTSFYQLRNLLGSGSNLWKKISKERLWMKMRTWIHFLLFSPINSKSCTMDEKLGHLVELCHSSTMVECARSFSQLFIHSITFLNFNFSFNIQPFFLKIFILCATFFHNFSSHYAKSLVLWFHDYICNRML